MGIAVSPCTHGMTLCRVLYKTMDSTGSVPTRLKPTFIEGNELASGNVMSWCSIMFPSPTAQEIKNRKHTFLNPSQSLLPRMSTWPSSRHVDHTLHSTLHVHLTTCDKVTERYIGTIIIHQQNVNRLLVLYRKEAAGKRQKKE